MRSLHHDLKLEVDRREQVFVLDEAILSHRLNRELLARCLKFTQIDFSEGTLSDQMRDAEVAQADVLAIHRLLY